MAAAPPRKATSRVRRLVRDAVDVAASLGVIPSIGGLTSDTRPRYAPFVRARVTRGGVTSGLLAIAFPAIMKSGREWDQCGGGFAWRARLSACSADRSASRFWI